ncbi:MAG: uroporphyrinogen decarboxylase family protein [Planctomycetota bacterium]|jgi:uroporphyrinogen-III decarboxylase
MANTPETLTVSPAMRDRMARLKRGLAGKADCVPVHAQISHHAARLLGQSTRAFYTDAETFVRCQLHAGDFYQIDSVPTHYDLYNIEAEALGAPMVWQNGLAPEVDPERRLLASVEDWRKLKPVRIGQAGRMPFVLEINRRLADLGLSAKVRFCGPVTLAAKLLGVNEFAIACATEPEKAHGLLTFLADEVIAPWIVCQRQHCSSNETASGADAYASPPLLSPPMVREFCLRYVQRLESTVGKVRMAALWGERHLSDPRELLDIKRLAYPGVLQALDPDVSSLGPKLFKQYADEHNMALIMGLDAGLIEHGPIKDIRFRARHFIDQAGQEGRFALFLNDIPYHTPPDHVHAAVAVAHDYRIR